MWYNTGSLFGIDAAAPGSNIERKLMNILVCNTGSTSLKFKLYEMPGEKMLLKVKKERVTDYEAGIREFMDSLPEGTQIDAVGFKTVLSKDHYGVHVIDDEVIRGMEVYMAVAPAHNTFYLRSIRVFKKLMPKTPLVGVFETAFHQTIPEVNYIYPVPYEWHEKYGVRKFGYHGASHGYVASKLSEALGEKYRAVSCHLGGSSSISAIVDGKCFDTSFGMSLQCGVPQSNRCGDVDPFIPIFMNQYAGLPYDEIEETLAKRSGLLGISGVSNDLRDILEAAAQGNHRAQLAFDIFCKEVTGYIGRFAAMMGGLDAVAFTGGAGESCEPLRNRVMEKISFMGDVKMFVIPADEELGVARETYKKLYE